jgi:hypothetical protein
MPGGVQPYAQHAKFELMSEKRCAEEAPEWKPKDGAPPQVHHFSDPEFLSVGAWIDGRYYQATARERLDYQDGRRSLLLFVYPALTDGRRFVRVWWDPRTVRVMSHGTSPVEAEAGQGDAVRVKVGDLPAGEPAETWYPIRSHPQVHVRVAGRWHEGTVFQRSEYPDGRVVLQVRVTFVEAGWPVYYWRHYWWDSSAIRPR